MYLKMDWVGVFFYGYLPLSIPILLGPSYAPLPGEGHPSIVVTPNPNRADVNLVGLSIRWVVIPITMMRGAIAVIA